MLTLLPGVFDAALVALGFIPARFAAVDPAAGALALPPVLTTLTYPLLTASWGDVLFEALIVLITGRFVENALGWKLLLAILLAASLIGASTYYLLAPDALAPLIGAKPLMSGAVGAYAALFSRDDGRAIGPIPARAVRIISLMLGWLVLMAALDFIATMAVSPYTVLPPAAGFAVGALLARPALIFRYRKA